MTTNDNKPIKAYKGFNQDMTCRGFQYEEGKEYEHSGPVEACASGFHACENPIDCLEYYRPGQSVFHFVELSGETSRDSNGSKVAASHIKIGARLDIAGICKATFDYVRSKCTNENNAEPGKAATAGNHGAATAGYRGAATAGYRGAATAGDHGNATAGYRGAATAGNHGAATAGNCGTATAGNCGAATAGNHGAATAGNHGAATAGNCGAATAGEYGAATAGEYGAATAGDHGAATAGNHGAATAGEYGAATAGNHGAATAGYRGAATARGSAETGNNGLSVARGNDVKVKGGIGAVLVIAEENQYDYNIKDWKATIVDGKHVKADTWYKLVNGEFVEAE